MVDTKRKLEKSLKENEKDKNSENGKKDISTSINRLKILMLATQFLSTFLKECFVW